MGRQLLFQQNRPGAACHQRLLPAKRYLEEWLKRLIAAFGSVAQQFLRDEGGFTGGWAETKRLAVDVGGYMSIRMKTVRRSHSPPLGS